MADSARSPREEQALLSTGTSGNPYPALNPRVVLLRGTGPITGDRGGERELPNRMGSVGEQSRLPALLLQGLFVAFQQLVDHRVLVDALEQGLNFLPHGNACLYTDGRLRQIQEVSKLTCKNWFRRFSFPEVIVQS